MRTSLTILSDIVICIFLKSCIFDPADASYSLLFPIITFLNMATKQTVQDNEIRLAVDEVFKNYDKDKSGYLDVS
jgi:Ca2+-binding EF-hand superfamily protein